jgi:hypothetical protein
MSYKRFLTAKTHLSGEHGFSPVYTPDKLFAFQCALLEWACIKGRSAVFADCGLGKTFVQLAWAENVARHTQGRVLILTPLAVSYQTVVEGEKLGIEVTHRRTGIEPSDRIVVTNYERLHHFNPDDFAGVVCDESSVLKAFDGETRKAVTDFLRKRPYRLLCTATAAPNDYIELGTSSEALGELGFADMISRFFTQKERAYARRDEYRPAGYRFRGHAERDFWRWVCSWARALRKPSDLGYSDVGFTLPALEVREHVVDSLLPTPGALFALPATNLQEQREELRRTILERCEKAAELVSAHNGPSVSWCHLNEEGRHLRKLIPGAVEVCGADSDERKEAVFADFAAGNVERLVTKPTIAGFGLNWQHCAHHTYFPSHSYEQYYQCVRRSYRFGQKNPVVVDLVATEGQALTLQNLKRKADGAAQMFERLVSLMRDELNIRRQDDCVHQERIPVWL